MDEVLRLMPQHLKDKAVELADWVAKHHPGHKVQFRRPPFSMHQRVRIKELDLTGRIVARYEADHGMQYKVRYFHNGDEKLVYLFGDEIEAEKA